MERWITCKTIPSRIWPDHAGLVFLLRSSWGFSNCPRAPLGCDKSTSTRSPFLPRCSRKLQRGPETYQQRGLLEADFFHKHWVLQFSLHIDWYQWPQRWESKLPTSTYPSEGWQVTVKSLSRVPTLCDPMDCSLPGSSLHGILQARVLEWVAVSFSRGSSRPRDQTRVSCIPGRRLNLWATRGWVPCN